MRGGRLNARDEHFINAAVALGAGVATLARLTLERASLAGSSRARCAIGAIGGHGEPGLQ